VIINTKIIAIASGKGGVGKSTVSSNLAISLSKSGSTVGLLDADIYGPSIPRIFGVSGQSVTSNDGRSFEPIESNGIQLMSIGFVQTNNDAMIWRGPMLSQAINQLLFQTNWNDLEYLIIDLPPGTGDAQLTISQKANLTGTILVTTPQNISLIDVEKSLIAFRKLDIEVLGLIENMSYFTDDSGKDHYIFGRGNIDDFSEKHGIELISIYQFFPTLLNTRIMVVCMMNFEKLSVLSKKV
jgi:ATPases involved in chromosome partitioning